jgi:2-polyprenyl-6-methoxyphenol hydroxylase-like FAD-dependent oxidoreductase
VGWNSTFHIGDRVASELAVGRVALAGDAAHIHSPVGARGMNLGIEDAYVYAACAEDVIKGCAERIKDYSRLRHSEMFHWRLAASTVEAACHSDHANLVNSATEYMGKALVTEGMDR